jgi:hypothetical protein
MSLIVPIDQLIPIQLFGVLEKRIPNYRRLLKTHNLVGDRLLQNKLLMVIQLDATFHINMDIQNLHLHLDLLISKAIDEEMAMLVEWGNIVIMSPKLNDLFCGQIRDYSFLESKPEFGIDVELQNNLLFAIKMNLGPNIDVHKENLNEEILKMISQKLGE